MLICDVIGMGIDSKYTENEIVILPHVYMMHDNYRVCLYLNVLKYRYKFGHIMQSA